MSSSVVDPGNKQMLWEILINLIDENDFYIPQIEEFQVFFEKTCRHYHIKRFDYNSLSEINKKVMADSFNYLKQVSQSKEKLIMFKKYKTDKNENNVAFNNKFKEYESNFKNLINKKTPDEINFAESIDAPISNMDEELNRRMASRDNDLSKIVDNYESENSLKWIASGGSQKLRIHDVDFQDTSDKVKLEIQEISNSKKNTERNIGNIEKKGILKDNRTTEIKQKIENQKKKVKFESEFINSIKNNEQGQLMAQQILNRDFEKNKNKEKIAQREKEAKMIRDIKTGYMQPNEMLMKQFELLNNNMNKHMEDEKETIDNKNNIIEMINEQDKEKNQQNSGLSSLFGNMKIKTENSDIIAATTGTDIIDVNKRIDKLEQYMYQIIENQYKIMQKLEEKPVEFKVVEHFNEDESINKNILKNKVKNKIKKTKITEKITNSIINDTSDTSYNNNVNNDDVNSDEEKLTNEIDDNYGDVLEVNTNELTYAPL